MSINKHLKKISRSQRRIIAVTALIISAFWIAGFFIYTPMKNKLAALSGELKGTEAQIQEIEKMISHGQEMGAGIRLLEEKSRQMESRFPVKEDTALTALFELSHKAKVEIVSIKTQPARLCGQQLALGERRCHELAVFLEMKGGYKELVGYIGLLKTSLPALMSLEKLNIYRAGTTASSLNIGMDIKLYLLI